MEIFDYKESKLHYSFAYPKRKFRIFNHPSTFELVEIQLICKTEHLWHDASSKQIKRERPQFSTCFTMKFQDFKNPEKTRQTLHNQLRTCKFPSFECKMIVDELIELAHKYRNRSVVVGDRRVLELGVRLDMSHMYKQIYEKYDSNIIARTLSSINCEICEEAVYGGSAIIKMCKHIFHFNCMKSWLDRNIGCPTCSHDRTEYLDFISF
ncbi:hypothetical protein AABB24_012912 [Solanum stoloniferum]|uniref:RING-type domain-containing protein n=1 Tax=Solanum stoloniferum TaxID=62892 RepID=A0ABD2U520_9SOLN